MNTNNIFSPTQEAAIRSKYVSHTLAIVEKLAGQKAALATYDLIVDNSNEFLALIVEEATARDALRIARDIYSESDDAMPKALRSGKKVSRKIKRVVSRKDE